MWFSKWILAAIRFGPAAVREDVGDQIGVRMDGGFAPAQTRWFAALEKNIAVWWQQPLTKATVVVLVVVLAVLVWANRSKVWNRSRLGAAVLMLPAALPVLWFELTKIHSQVHSFFVYRTIAVIVGILLAAAVAVITCLGSVGVVPAARESRLGSRLRTRRQQAKRPGIW